MDFLNKEEYLKFGIIGKPFKSDVLIYAAVKNITDYNSEKGIGLNQIEALLKLIHTDINMYTGEEFLNRVKYNRTCEDICNTALATGSNDYAIVFSTFAKQLKIPTTMLHTAKNQWVQKFLKTSETENHSKHTFCECYYNGKWILVDPINNMIMEKYNDKKIKLPYFIDDSDTYIPFVRDIDANTFSNEKAYNAFMEYMVKKECAPTVKTINSRKK